MANTNDRFGDERLKKADANVSHGSRDGADADRTQQNGTSLSASERRRLLEQSWVQEILPSPPAKAGWHRCWLSTSSSIDPIFRRIALGYQPVKSKDIPGFGNQYSISGGEFDGCIACNEMILFEIPSELYNDLMTINHYDKPLREESGLRERVDGSMQRDGQGNNLGRGAEGFDQFGRQKVPEPTSFI